MTTPTLITERLLLRPPGEDDHEQLHRIVFADADVMAQAFFGRVFTLDETRTFIRDRFDHAGDGHKPGVLAMRATGEVVGFAGLMPCRALGEEDYEIGFVLARAFWGQGFASEIGRAQLEFGFDKIGCQRLLALASPQNRGSIAVLGKLGMAHDSTVDDQHRGKRLVYRIDRRDREIRHGINTAPDNSR